MSLAQFAHAVGEPGYTYELERGVVVVVDVPGVPHERVKQNVRDVLAAYRLRHADRINLVADGSGSVIRMWAIESERHPDLSIYLSPPPTDDEQPWDEWTPDIVIEVVSRTSRRRDYGTKAVDYLAAGIREYWVIDPLTRSATIHTRRGDTWRKKSLGARGFVRTTMLPEFELSLIDVFAALK